MSRGQNILQRIRENLGGRGGKYKRIRKQYLGWFIAAILLFLLTHTILLITLVTYQFFALQSFAMFLVLVAPATLTGVTHYAARTFASTHSTPTIWSNWRHKLMALAVLIMVGVIITLNIIVGRPIVNSFTTRLAVIFVIAEYLLAGVAGWDVGKLKATHERLERPPQFRRPEKINPYQVLQIGSARKLILFSGLNLAISGVIGWTVNWGLGATFFFGIPAYYDLMMRLNEGVIE